MPAHTLNDTCMSPAAARMGWCSCTYDIDTSFWITQTACFYSIVLQVQPACASLLPHELQELAAAVQMASGLLIESSGTLTPTNGPSLASCQKMSHITRSLYSNSKFTHRRFSFAIPSLSSFSSSLFSHLGHLDTSTNTLHFHHNTSQEQLQQFSCTHIRAAAHEGLQQHQLLMHMIQDC